jgi:hypothetical protein
MYDLLRLITQNLLISNNSWRMRWGRGASHHIMVEVKNVCKTLDRKPEAKRQLQTPRSRWEDNKIDRRKIGRENVD